MSDEQLAHRLREIAEQDVPGSLDLWQSIRAEINASPLRQPRRSLVGRIASHISAFQVRTPTLVALALTLLLVAFGLTAVPNAQGRIDGMLRRFGLMLVNSTTMSSGTTHRIGQTDKPALAKVGRSRWPPLVRHSAGLRFRSISRGCCRRG
jgi:hypothetical protein